ncbi:MAG: hypothetical protein P0Y53_19015 [Candidatus Pseudobacter hemicellulosilyticus]|uniref:Uncharacterized protein n=1 Tax=Candidatus Pseudobacter hemicellulosilyticus TaxID=3121375 RepID=A0AAJ5WQ86_9BACT|nr:MAG: hypothetical protein P0Y53_19015 [Pseudobacter sp.]
MHKRNQLSRGYYLACSLLLAGGLFLAGSRLEAQTGIGIRKADQALMERREDSLKNLSRAIVQHSESAGRMRADSLFVRTLVRALLVPQSFYYPFDSLNISKLYAPDSTFRIFTWQVKKDEYVLWQKGAIQLRTSDGSLKLIPLHDVSMFTARGLDSARTTNNWIGAIYYRIIMKEFQGKKYYTLLGFDDFSVASNKKWMDVLHFDAQGKPVFGGSNMISFKEDSVRRPGQARYSIEYKKEARAFFNYDPELDMIIVDHLISETDEPEKKDTYIPDGDYEAFKWQNGQWVHVNKLFSQMQADGDFPRDAMILDDAGNVDERKLEEQSRRNIERAQKEGKIEKPATKKPTAPAKKIPVKKN